MSAAGPGADHGTRNHLPLRVLDRIQGKASRYRTDGRIIIPQARHHSHGTGTPTRASITRDPQAPVGHPMAHRQ